MIDDQFNTWLIEINSSPAMDHSTHVTEKLVKVCLSDIAKVAVDRHLAPRQVPSSTRKKRISIPENLYCCIRAPTSTIISLPLVSSYAQRALKYTKSDLYLFQKNFFDSKMKYYYKKFNLSLMQYSYRPHFTIPSRFLFMPLKYHRSNNYLTFIIVGISTRDTRVEIYTVSCTSGFSNIECLFINISSEWSDQVSQIY